MWHASKHTLTTSVMAQDVRKTYVTSCPSYSLWFARFMTGMHKRISDVVKQDKAVTLDVIHRLIEGLEEDFLTELDPAAKEKISDAALFILASFLGGLRGEETLKLVLGEARQYITEAENHCKHKHVILPLRGRFKGETCELFHFVDVTTKTDSGLMIGA